MDLNKQAEIKNVNLVKLLGDVVDVNSDILRIKTNETDFAGTDYEEFHEVHCNGHGKKVGDRVLLYGHMKTIDTELGPKTVIFSAAENMTKAMKKDKSKNIAKVVGMNPFSFQFFPRAEGKQAFGNLLIVSDIDKDTNKGQFHRGVMFGNLATMFSRACTKRSIVSIIGRLKNREYKTDTGYRTILEIMVDDDQGKILRRGEIIDEFADFETKDEVPVPAI